MIIRIRLADGSAYQLNGVEVEGVSEQLDNENEFIEFIFENAEVQVYKRYIMSVEWRVIESD